MCMCFQGANLSSLASDTFAYNTRVTAIDLSDNPYTELPLDIYKVRFSAINT